jgi:hypothetical protein
MAFIYDPATFKTIANNLGLADKNLRDELDITIVGSGISLVTDSRDLISAAVGDASIGNTDLDASTTLLQAFRSKESALPSNLISTYTSLITAIDTYFSSSKSKTSRNYFDSKTPDTTLDFVSSGTASSTGLSYFRRLYERTQGTELITKMYFCSQSAGTISAGSGLTAYGHTSDFTNAALEVRLPNNYVGSATTMTVTGLSSTGTTLSISVTVGSGNSTANVGTSQKFVSLSSIGVPSGLGNTLIEIWVR